MGCGRTGSAVAKQLAGEGWDVTCIDDDETRSDASVSGAAASSSATGWTSRCSSAPEWPRMDAAVVATDGDNTNLVIGQVLQRRYEIGCVVVRVLDPSARGVLRGAGAPDGLPHLKRRSRHSADVVLRSCEARPQSESRAH